MPNPKARIYGALDVMYVDFGVFQGIVKLQSTIYCRPACPNDPPKSSKWSMINVNQPTNFRSVTCCETRHGLRRYWWRGGGQTAMRRYATNSSWMWHTTSKVFFFHIPTYPTPNLITSKLLMNFHLQKLPGETHSHQWSYGAPFAQNSARWMQEHLLEEGPPFLGEILV